MKFSIRCLIFLGFTSSALFAQSNEVDTNKVATVVHEKIGTEVAGRSITATGADELAHVKLISAEALEALKQMWDGKTRMSSDDIEANFAVLTTEDLRAVDLYSKRNPKNLQFANPIELSYIKNLKMRSFHRSGYTLKTEAAIDSMIPGFKATGGEQASGERSSLKIRESAKVLKLLRRYLAGEIQLNDDEKRSYWKKLTNEDRAALLNIYPYPLLDIKARQPVKSGDGGGVEDRVRASSFRGNQGKTIGFDHKKAPIQVWMDWVDSEIDYWSEKGKKEESPKVIPKTSNNANSEYDAELDEIAKELLILEGAIEDDRVEREMSVDEIAEQLLLLEDSADKETSWLGQADKFGADADRLLIKIKALKAELNEGPF